MHEFKKNSAYLRRYLFSVTLFKDSLLQKKSFKPKTTNELHICWKLGGREPYRHPIYNYYTQTHTRNHIFFMKV